MATLTEILKSELIHYAGHGANCFAFPIFDDDHQTYTVNVVDYPIRKRPSDLIIFARVLEDKIIIEEDFSDKPLVEKLVQQGIARDQIVLIYQGEPYPIGAIPTMPMPYATSA